MKSVNIILVFYVCICLFYHYFQQFKQGGKSSIFVLCTQNEQAMYYSITELAHAPLALGETMHEVYKLKTTDLYQPFNKLKLSFTKSYLWM